MFTVKVVVFAGVFLSHVAFGRFISLEDILPYLNATFLSDSEGDSEGSSCGRGPVCETEVCKKAAKDILDGLNPDVDPCDDFYSFTCGGWIKDNPVPPTEIHWNQFDIIDRKVDSQVHHLLAEKPQPQEPEIVKTAKRIYKACMDTERIEKRGLTPLLNLLEEFNNWPMATKTWYQKNRPHADWQKTFGDIERKLALGSILFVYVDVDRKNTSRNVIIVDEPNLFVPKFLYMQSESSFVFPYVNYIVKAAELVLKARNETADQFSLHVQALRVFRFERQLAKLMRTNEEKRVAEYSYDLTTLGLLQNWTLTTRRISPVASVNWFKLFANILGIPEKDLTHDTLIAVTSWKYLSGFLNLIKDTPPKVLADYMLWRVVQKFSRDLSKELLELNFSLKRQLSAINEDHPRWRDCVSTTNYLSFVVGYMYVQKHFTAEAKSKAIEMVRDIRSAFRQQLINNPWMDEQSKREALEKAEVMNEFIGYPDWFDNVTYLEEYYKGIKIGDDHFENKVNLREFLAGKLRDNLKMETNRNEWTAGPAIANAYYNPFLNSIIFPAGVLQDPFFNKDQPEALNYGGIGAVVGHEITHAFDDMGRQSDRYGNIKHWWTKETESTYQKNALCFKDQYSNYFLPELDHLVEGKARIDGYRTLDENIADNGGLNAALTAYLSHLERTDRQDMSLPGLERYTSEQLFYIGFARVWCESNTSVSLLTEILDDPHSPHRFRVLGSLSNSEHFAKTWWCPLGTKMNPPNKCKLW